MADAHWAASARMPSNLLLAEAITAAQEAGRHGHHPDAAQWVVVLQHLRHCCQAYRQVLTPLLSLSPPPLPLLSSPSSSPHPPPSPFPPLPPPYCYPCSAYPPSSAEVFVHFPRSLFLFLFLFFAPATVTFANSTTCHQLQTCVSPPPRRQHHKEKTSPQLIP